MLHFLSAAGLLSVATWLLLMVHICVAYPTGVYGHGCGSTHNSSGVKIGRPRPIGDFLSFDRLFLDT